MAQRILAVEESGLRVLFAGSSAFALPALRDLASSHHQLVAVLTAPPRAGSRGRPAPRPVAELARELGLPTLQPERLRGSDLDSALELGAQVLVVCAYGQLVPRLALDRLPQGGLGVHPSLLPRHRGASPVAAAILAGDLTTGVSIFQMVRRMDAGPILVQVESDLAPDVTTPELEAELAELGARLLPSALDAIEAGTANFLVQDESLATYAPKLARESGRLSWDLEATVIDRSVRALQPWPGVTLPLRGERVKVLRGARVEVERASQLAGAELGWVGESLLVAAGAGGYRLDLVQPPGGRAMSAASYLRGRRAVSP